MNHDEIKQKALEMFDGDFIDKKEAALCKEHLASCKACAEDLRLWKSLRGEIQGVEAPVLSDNFARSVLSEIKGGNEARMGALLGKWFRSVEPPVWQVWTTASIFAVCMIYSIMPGPTNAADSGQPSHLLLYENDAVAERFYAPEQIESEEAGKLILGETAE